MKRVLLTGSAGFAGYHIVEHFLRHTDWQIIGLDSFRHRGDSVRVGSDGRHLVYCHDLNAPISTRLASQIGPVDYIINAASESHVDRSISDPIPFVQNNVNIALHMLDFAVRFGCEHFIQISTDEVFGPALGGYDHQEWDHMLPSNPYSASKAAQEAIAISYWRTYGVPLTITSTMNMFGEMQDSEKFVPKCIRAAITGETLTIHGTEQNIGSRKYLHSRNHADALMHILRWVKPTMYEEKEREVVKPNKFNVVGDVELDNLQLAKMVASIVGKELSYQFVDFHAITTRPGHDRRYSLDGSFLASTGWKAPVKFEDSLVSTVVWYLNHGEWL